MSKKVTSQMAGTVLEMLVKVGDSVQSGQDIAILESMKMEVPVTSPQAGKVTELFKNKGDFVNEGEALIEMSE